MSHIPYYGEGVDSETEEEHAVRIARIAEEIRLDMKAGRYHHGQLHKDVRHKDTDKLVDGMWQAQTRWADKFMHEMHMDFFKKFYMSSPMPDHSILDSLPKSQISSRYDTATGRLRVTEDERSHREMMKRASQQIYGKRVDTVVLDEMAKIQLPPVKLDQAFKDIDEAFKKEIGDA